MVAIGVVAVLLSVLYLVAAVAVYVGFRPTRASTDRDAGHRFTSVVVAARNEEPTIPHLLDSLCEQDIGADAWELIVIDDRSEDETFCVVSAYIDRLPNLRLMRVDSCPPHLAGKQNALAVGIEQARGEVILMTDADCRVPPCWVRTMASSFDRSDTGVVAGMVRLPEPGSTWEWLQAADMAHLLATQSGTIGMGVPMTAIGNNLALRRAAYDVVGGYEALGRTIVEDCAIVQRVARAIPWRVVVANPHAAVLTEPVESVWGFLRQRARWATGSFLLRRHQLAFIVGVFIQRAATLAATAMSIHGSLAWVWSAAAWGVWMIADAVVISRYAATFANRRLLVLSPCVTLWQAAYHVFCGAWAVVLPGAISWKELPGEATDA